MKFLVLFAVTSITALVAACATTPYGKVPVAELTDAQLVAEVNAAAKGVAASINTAQYIAATRPDPAYVLTSSKTNYFGTGSASISAYAMPAGRGYAISGSSSGRYSGVASTQYYYTDVNALNRGIHDVGTVIASARAAQFRQRGLDALSELQVRIERRRNDMQHALDDFFAENPKLVQKQKLIAAILPWTVTSTSDSLPKSALEEAKQIALSIDRGKGVGGTWYGVFSQESTLPSGVKSSFSQFVRITLRENGQEVTGSGEINSPKQQLTLTGKSDDNRFSGALANTTAGINVTFSGLVVSDQMTGSFEGGGTGMRISGTVALFR